MARRKEGQRPAWLSADNRYDLLWPVEYREGEEAKTLSQVKLNRLTSADLLIMDQAIPFTEKLLQIVERQTGLMRVVTLKIDAADMDRIDDIFGFFREPGQPTGATS